MQVDWGTCGNEGVWCSFHAVNLEHSVFDREGVYIVWERGGRILRVGKGRLKDKIAEDRKNPVLASNNKLLVTWATVSSKERSAIEKYLTQRLQPQIANQVTDATPIEVNLPWPYS